MREDLDALRSEQQQQQQQQPAPAAAATTSSNSTTALQSVVDDLAEQVFGLRVEVQNQLGELGQRLGGVEGNLDIWEASTRAVAVRAEAAKFRNWH